VESYHVCWPGLTAKRVQPVVSISWACCTYLLWESALVCARKTGSWTVKIPFRNHNAPKLTTLRAEIKNFLDRGHQYPHPTPLGAFHAWSRSPLISRRRLFTSSWPGRILCPAGTVCKAWPIIWPKREKLSTCSLTLLLLLLPAQFMQIRFFGSCLIFIASLD